MNWMNTGRDVELAERLVEKHPEMAEELQQELALNSSVILPDWSFHAIESVELFDQETIGGRGRTGTTEFLAESEIIPLANRKGNTQWKGEIAPKEVVRTLTENPEQYSCAHGEHVYTRPLDHYSDKDKPEVDNRRGLVRAIIELGFLGWLKGPMWGLESMHDYNLFSRFTKVFNQPDLGKCWKRELDMTPIALKAVEESPEVQDWLRRIMGSTGTVISKEELFPSWDKLGKACEDQTTNMGRYRPIIPGQDELLIDLELTYDRKGYNIVVYDPKDIGGSTGDGKIVIGKITCTGRLVESETA